jgi:hypothetical protein
MRCWIHLLGAIAAVAAVLAGCAALPAPEQDLESRVGAILERRGLGPDALLVIDNLLRHGPPAPVATPPLVLALLERPLDALNASSLFRQLVPASLLALETTPANGSFDELLKTYLGELAEAQRMLRAATKVLEEEALLRELSAGLPSGLQLIAVSDAVDAAQLQRANLFFIEATARFATGIRNAGPFPDEPKQFQSAIGTVVIGTRGNDRHGPDAALIIDPGGDDVYERMPARGGAVSVIVDLGGNDEYRGADPALRGLSAIVYLDGDDRYAMEGSGLAAAIAGASLLIDFGGNDTTRRYFATPARLALIDPADRYRHSSAPAPAHWAAATIVTWPAAYRSLPAEPD